MKALNGPHPWWHRRFSSGVNKLKKLSFDLLSGAWFHKKNIGDTEVIDETPDVDTSRTWHKARALQFTDSTDYVSISKTYPSTDTPTSFEVTLEVIIGNSIVSTQDIFCTDDAGQAAGIQLRIENYSSDWRFGLRVGDVVGRDTSFAVETNTRYILVISYSDNTATLTVNGATNLTITPTSAIAGAGLIMLGRRYTTLGNYFNGILGYLKIKEDNIVIGEYAFEEGAGTICYNRVMNNFHGTINNATISTFRVEDIRITNGDQGTFLNTDGYSPLNMYTSDFSSGVDGWSNDDTISTGGVTILGVENALEVELTNGSQVHQITKSFVYQNGQEHKVEFDYYIPSGSQIGQLQVTGLSGATQTNTNVTGSWQTMSVTGGTAVTTSIQLRIQTASGGNTIDDDGAKVYFKNIVITQPNVYIPRPRVTDIPLYNAGKYAYYIPDHANNFIDLNTAFAGLTNPGDWMEFGIATVGTGEPDSETGSWATHTSGGSQFFANIASGVDFRFFGPNGGQNQMRTVVASIDIPNNDFYLLKVTKTVEAPAGTSGTVGQLDLFDRDGNLIVSHNLSAGTLGNEGTYTFDRFFPQTYSTDFILAYLKLSDGTVWNGANDFNGGVNITNTGTGNVTKIFFESVDEDVLGNPLTYKGQVAQPLSLVNSNGAYLDTPHKVDFSQINVSDFTMTFYAYLDSSLAGASTNRELFTDNNTSQGLLFFSDQRLYYYAAGHSGIYNFSPHIPDEEVVDKWQKFSIIRNDSANTISFVVENDSRTVTTDPAQSGAIAPYDMIGKRYSGPGLGGTLAWASLHSKAMTIEEARAIDPYNMDTDSLEIFLVPSAGNGSTVYDVSGNNNHGTIVNATLSDFWIKQDQFHWNLKKGFSLYDDDATGTIIQRVPLGLNPTISGYTKVSDNPAGKWHNDAETEINFPHTATFEVLNRQFTTAPFFTKNAERYTSDFSSTTDGFAAIVGANGSVAANIDGVTDDAATSFDNCLRYTAASGTNLQHGVLTSMDNILELRTNVDGSNQVFYAEVRFLLPSTNNQINGFRVWTGWGVQGSSNPFNFPQANNDITSDAVGAWRKEMFGPFTMTDIGGSSISLRLQGLNGTDFTINNDAFEDLIYIESVRVIQMPTLKDVTFADMYQTWYDYEYLHRLFAHFVVPNQVHNILAYTDELTAAQKQQVYDYLQKNYHPIYTPYSTRVLADGGTLAAGQTNTLTIIDSI